MIDLLLVNPPSPSLTITPPLGLAMAGAVLRRDGFRVAVLDCIREGLGPAEAAARAILMKPRAVGVSLLPPRYPGTREFVAEFRRHGSGVRVIAGGPPVSALPRESLEWLDADLAYAGEAEAGLSGCLDAVLRWDIQALRAMKGIAFRAGSENESQIVWNEGFHQAPDLDALPLPDWSLCRPAGYPRRPHNFLYRAFPIAGVVTSRGCRQRCAFCSSTAATGPGVRYRSPRHVADEIELLSREYGVREFHIHDEDFSADREHALGVCRELIRRGLRLPWKIPGGLRYLGLDEELVDAFRDAGCYQLGIGIESFDAGILRRHHRPPADTEALRASIRLIRSKGIEVYGNFILGLPGETRETVAATVRKADSLDLDFHHFGLYTPMPGSELFDRLRAEGRRFDFDYWSRSSFAAGGGESFCDLSYGELKRWQRRAVLTTQLRPRRLVRYLAGVKPRQVPDFLRLVWKYLF